MFAMLHSICLEYTHIVGYLNKKYLKELVRIIDKYGPQRKEIKVNPFSKAD